MIDKLTKITPIVAASLIFLGVLKLMLYYSYFNIKIIDYLDFQEIITSFLGDINILILFGLIMILTSLFTINTISKSTKTHFEKVLDRLETYTYIHRVKYLIFFAITILTLGTLLLYGIINYNYFVIYVIVFSVFQFQSFLSLTKNENNEIDIPNFYMTVILGISLTTSIFLLSQKQIKESEKQIIEVRLKMENKTITCSKESKNIFIGKTNKYSFIRMNNSKTTIVVPNEKILQYEYK